MNKKTLLSAIGVAAAMAFGSTPAYAVPITGQLDINGSLSSSSFFGLGNAGVDIDFDPQTAAAQIATGSFAPIVTVPEFLANPLGPTITGFDLFDIDFEAGTPFTIYTTNVGFTPVVSFTATNYGLFDNDASDGTRGFVANGIISIDGFDDTVGVLAVSTQEVKQTANVSFSSSTVVPLPAGIVFLMTALGGLGFIARRKSLAV